MRHRLLLHVFALVTLFAWLSTARVEAFDSSDTLTAIDQAAVTVGVPAERLTRVVSCETAHTFNPYAVGDWGTSFGAAQLHRGGNALPIFYAVGYTDPDDPYQAIEFMARAFRGDFPHLGWWTWSCR